MSSHVRILGIAGSLRRGSYNQAALRAAKLLVPENSEIDLFQLDGIPMFNEDDEKRPPSSVLELKKRIRRADAVLIVTPEYNYSIPGVLKNAIDWACRPHGDSAWSGKPAAIMGASLGAIGTARAQYHLRQILVALNLFTLNQPEVVIADAAHRFDENGNLIHEPTKQLIQELLKNLVDWTRRISPAPESTQHPARQLRGIHLAAARPPEPPSAPAKPRVLVVYAHPNPKSYTHAVLEAVQAGVGERCEVQTLDLYATGFDPVLVVDETRRRRDLDQVEETRAIREQLAWCDAMLFVYPVWWGGFPAMLNGYLDRTFVSGLTYSFEGRPRTAVFPHGLMRDKEAHLFYTLDSPWLFALLDPGWFSNLFTVFWYCGFRRVRRYYLARLKLRTDEQRARWLVTVREHAGRIAERLPGPNFACTGKYSASRTATARHPLGRARPPDTGRGESLLKGLIVTTSNR